MIKKRFYKTKDYCQVTFEFPKGIVDEVEDPIKAVALVGDFNDWDETATPLKKVRGVWKTTLQLDEGQEYQYRFLVNGETWYNDWEADKYIPNNVDGDNSVVVLANGVK